MQRLISFYNADRADKLPAPTNYQTRQNQNEVYCDLCGEAFYVNDVMFELLTRKIEETLENPFVCQECLDEYEEYA